jgi:SAM-dependent methyltransferase
MNEARPNDEEMRAKQRRYWNAIAGPRWVANQGFLERRMQSVNERLLAHAAPAVGEKVLEIGCGTGATTLLLAAAVGASGRVLAVDISEPMLEAARRRLEDSSFRQVRLLLADAATESFERAFFDLAISRFGVMFFADPAAAFKNLLAALGRGGRLVFACWAPLAENPHWLIPYEVALRHLGPGAPQPLRAPGPLSLSDPVYVEAILSEAGFANIAIRREGFAVIGSTSEEEADHAMRMGPAARLLDEKKPGEEVRARIRREMALAFAAYGQKELPATLYLVSARRPR